MKRLPVLVVLAALAGCEMDAEITVSGPASQPRFDVTYDGGKRACIQGLTVTDVGGTARRDVWAIRRLDRRDMARCVTSVTFGQVPAGYEAALALRKTVPGAPYEVSASGAGWHAKAPFALR